MLCRNWLHTNPYSREAHAKSALQQPIVSDGCYRCFDVGPRDAALRQLNKMVPHVFLNCAHTAWCARPCACHTNSWSRLRQFTSPKIIFESYPSVGSTEYFGKLHSCLTNVPREAKSEWCIFNTNLVSSYHLVQFRIGVIQLVAFQVLKVWCRVWS